MITANGGERHHIVSASALTQAGFYSPAAPAIRMMAGDHANTPNYINSTYAIEFRKNELIYLKSTDYENLLLLEVAGLKNSADSEGKYSNLQEKYYDQVVIALAFAEKYFGIS